jgi:NitT/TauT family transport system substrate-binding protein
MPGIARECLRKTLLGRGFDPRTSIRMMRPLGKGTLMSRIAAVALAAVFALAAPGAWGQGKSEIKITRQPSIIYMPTHIMEAQKLIEKQAAARGLPDLKVEWINFSGGGNATDALLTGNVDVVNTGVGNMLLLWDRTKGGVKGIVATSALPLILVTRDPKIKSLRDYEPTDKIAVPTVKVSTQAILLQIAAEKEFGAGQETKLDASTVQMSHPDAFIALTNPRHEVASHFSAPPIVFQELKTVPGAHLVTDSAQILGTPLTVAVMFATTRFADGNPKAVEAIRAASAEALDMIRNDTRKAVEIYKESSKDRLSVDELVEMLKEPGMMAFGPEPQGTMKFAEHLHKIGTLRTKPMSWKDFFLPASHDLAGN